MADERRAENFSKLFFVRPERNAMGKKDVYTRPYFADKKRFADFINVHLYGGKEIVMEGALVKIRGIYPSAGSFAGEKSRDVFMEHEKLRMRYGIELETESDYGMPERIMVYDGGEYEKQIGEKDKKHRSEKEYAEYIEKKSRMKESDRLVPVISIVLYLGEGKWRGPRRLKEMLEVPKELKECSEEYLQDYKICVIEADFVDAGAYWTDLKEFFQALQCRNDRERLRELLGSEGFRNLERETEMAIAVNLSLKPIIRKIEEEEKGMCRAFEELMMEQEEIGIEKGKSEGIKEGIKESIKALIETCKELGVSREDTESRIIMKLDVSRDDAMDYVNQYWG